MDDEGFYRLFAIFITEVIVLKPLEVRGISTNDTSILAISLSLCDSGNENNTRVIIPFVVMQKMIRKAICHEVVINIFDILY